VPVHNGATWLTRVLDAILAQADGRPMEVIVIDDGSRDRSREILERYAATGSVVVLEGAGRGPAAAINLGIRHASYPIVFQVDQDVVLHPGWMAMLSSELEDGRVAAAQGYYQAPDNGSLWSRVMGLDLEQRYARIEKRDVDHVCTGNTAYRADALRAVGLFDEALGYGYDNDISYRLTRAGYRLVICRQATSTHEWRDDFRGYVRQQYGFGYGRIDLVFKHRGRLSGDDVSPVHMMLHAPLMAVGIVAGGAALALALAPLGHPSTLATWLSAGIILALAVERCVAGARAAARFRDPAGLLFAPVHLVRDVAWTAAIASWIVRRVSGRISRPGHSMHPRTAKTP
jgi:cellulose synthase/poly-beta-1,6-N-acetylglucosamine synthase-like glycosyltransferase